MPEYASPKDVAQNNVFMPPSPTYEAKVLQELHLWQQEMLKDPSLLNRLSRSMQQKLNSYIPEKVHNAITATIKQMIRAVLFGAKHTTAKPAVHSSLEAREAAILERIEFYKKTRPPKGESRGPGAFCWGWLISRCCCGSS